MAATPNMQGYGSLQTFDTAMRAANAAGKPAVLTFGSPQCKHCRAMQPVLTDAAAKVPNAAFVNFNVSANPADTRAILGGISKGPNAAFDSVPATFIVPPNGQAALRYTGPRTAEGIAKAVNMHCYKKAEEE